MWITLLLLLGYLLIPVLLIYLTHVSSTLKKTGAVVLAYAVGLFLGNVGLFPVPSDAFREMTALLGKNSLPQNVLMEQFQNGNITSEDLIVNRIASMQEMIYSISIMIAIPLILFSLDMKRWLGLASEAFKSTMLALISLFAAVIIGYLVWGVHIEEGSKVGGMLVGVYTGGTPNLALLAVGLGVNQETYILTHTYDVVLGALFLLFLMTVAQRTFNLILPHFSDSKKHKAICKVIKETEGIDNYLGMLNLKAAGNLGIAFILAILIFGIGYGLSMLFPKSAQMTVIVLTITTLGILASLNKRINKIEYTFQFGMYFIIVFSLALSSIANLRTMIQGISMDLFLYVAIAIFGSMIIHVMLSKIFKVDTDTTIITITALTYSTPFVPAVAAAIRNKEIIISGLAVGTLGYAFGTYAGMLIYQILQWL